MFWCRSDVRLELKSREEEGGGYLRVKVTTVTVWKWKQTVEEG